MQSNNVSIPAGNSLGGGEGEGKGKGYEGLHSRNAPVVRFGIFWVEFYCARCDKNDSAFRNGETGRGEERTPRLTGILQTISVLLKFDARICAIAEYRRIVGVARYRFGVQLSSSHKFAGCSGKAEGRSADKECV